MWSAMQPETKLMSMGHAVVGGHVDVNGLCGHRKPGLISVIRAASEGLVCICGPTAASGHVHRQSCCQKLCKSSWLVLLLTAKSKEATLAVILITEDARLRKERGTPKASLMTSTLPTLALNQSNSLNGNQSKRTLQSVIRMPKFSSLQLMASDRGLRRKKDSVLFKGQSTKSLIMLQQGYR